MLGTQSPLLSKVTDVSHRFFNRIGGTSPKPQEGLNTAHGIGDAPARVNENLARVRFQLGVGRQALYTATQVHGVKVVEVNVGDDIESVERIEADGLLTCAADVAVGVRTADCVPVLFAAKDGSLVGAVHAGWRSAAGNILGAFVDAAAAKGVAPDQLVAAVGPAIGVDHFEVGPEVVEAFEQLGGELGVDVGPLVRHFDDKNPHFDLKGFCAELLRARGVDVDLLDGDTFADAETYFSHRRDQGRTGRMLAAIARTTPPELPHEDPVDEEWTKELWDNGQPSRRRQRRVDDDVE